MKRPLPIRFLVSSILLAFLFSQMTLQSGCANIIPPEGGPRDSLPPMVRRASPRDSATHFSGDRITLTFDEYVNADNYLQEMIVSPVPANLPTVTRKLNVVTVKLRDTLQPNTTYSINFGNTIKDVNEGNALKNFTYIFSTGSYLDSFEFRGKVLLAETGEVDTTLTVMLHPTNLDSALIKEKPRYIARLDGKGEFRFRNLAPGTYYPYALKDEGASYRYLNKTQLFAFADSAVQVSSQTPTLTLYAYAGRDSTPIRPSGTASGTNNRNVKAADKRLKFTTNLTGDRQDLLDNFEMTFENKLKAFDSAKVHFTADTTYRVVTGYRWELDSAKKKLTLVYPWQEDVQYNLILEKDFATDTFGYQLLKPDTVSIHARPKKEYGKLTLRFRNLDLTQQPVLQFVQNSKVVRSFRLSSNRLTVELVLPGDYNLRLLRDRNGNGVWDPGVFFGKRQQPEIVKPLARVVNVKSDRDNQVDVDVNALPPPKEAPIQQNSPGPGNRGRSNTRPGGRSNF